MNMTYPYPLCASFLTIQILYCIIHVHCMWHAYKMTGLLNSAFNLCFWPGHFLDLESYIEKRKKKNHFIYSNINIEKYTYKSRLEEQRRLKNPLKRINNFWIFTGVMRKIYPVQWENPTIGTNTLRDVPLDTQGIPRLGWAKVFFTLKFYMFVFCSQNMGSWVKFFHHKTSLPPPLEFQNGVPLMCLFQ